jgi:hypothetical protein
MKRILPLLLLPFLSMSAVALPAAAQSIGPGGAGSVGVPSFAPQKGVPRGPKREPAPPALPGARAEPTAVAPAERNAADLPPTEALFDAINRGDLPTARDAVSRGADLNGTNVLGLTPLDLAIDLGRNEISFLLLTLRGGSGFNTTQGPAATTPQSRAATARAERDAARTAAREGRAAERQAVAARPSNGPSPQAPRLFAGQGGAAVPQAGFLGFDAGR